MKAILINPTDKSVTVIDHTGEYEDIKTSLGCEWIEGISLGHGITLYVNEEGLLAPNPGPFFRLRGGTNTYAGRGLVVCHTEDGESIMDLPPFAVYMTLSNGFVTFPDVTFLGFEKTEGVEEHPIFGRIATVRRTAKFSDGR